MMDDMHQKQLQLILKETNTLLKQEHSVYNNNTYDQFTQL